MALKSENSVSKTRRRRRGTTSPPLTNIHPNPGPHRRAARRKRPSDSQSPHGVYLSEEKSDNIVKRLKAKKSQESIAKELKCSLKAVKRRAAKLKQKGEYARTPQGGKWRGSSRKRFAKEAKDSDKVNEEGDKANEGPGLGWMLVSGGDVVPRRRWRVLDTEFSDFRAIGLLEKGPCCRQGKTALSCPQ